MRARYAAVALLAAAVMFCIIPATTRAAADDDAQAQTLLQKHRSYVGWQYGDGTLRSMKITGNVTDEKSKRLQDFTIVYAGLAYRHTITDLKLGSLVEYVGYTGSVFWDSDYSGFTTPVFGDSAKYLAAYSILIREGTTALTGTYRGTKTIDGKSLGIVRVSLPNVDAIDLYVDPETGAYVQAVVDPDGSYETTYHIVSYAEAAPGKKMISSYRVDDDKSLVSFTKLEGDVTVSDGDLHPPPPTASWTFVNQNPVPIKVTHDRFLVDATVNGVKGTFILDTGADSIYMDERFADRAHVNVDLARTHAATLYGTVDTKVRNATDIDFGGASLHNAVVLTQQFDRDDYRGLDWQGYSGLIGFDLFAGTVVKLDVYDAKLTILDPSSDVHTDGALELVLDLSDGIPVVPMMLNKTIPVNAMLDTGSPGLVFYGPELNKKHHLTTTDCVNLDSLALGPIVYGHQEACEADLDSNYMLVGFDFLKHFDYIFDYPHARLYMTPNANH